MPDVWQPVIELTGTADHPDDSIEAAEEFKAEVGDNQRVVIVETNDKANQAYVERKFSDGGGGYVQIGKERNPDEDYQEIMIDMVDSWQRGDVRLVYDYTNCAYCLEQWVEPD